MLELSLGAAESQTIEQSVPKGAARGRTLCLPRNGDARQRKSVRISEASGVLGSAGAMPAGGLRMRRAVIAYKFFGQ